MLKTMLLWVALAAVCAASLWQKMEWTAIASIFFLCLVTYRHRTVQVLEWIENFLASARLAKLGQFEIQVDRAKVPVTSFREMMLADLSPSHLGLLVQIRTETDFAPSGAIMNKLRELRSRGLLRHDKESLGDSRRVWLTPAGEAVADSLIQGTMKDQAAAAHAS